MYAIKMNDDKSLSANIKATIYQGERRADTLVFFIPMQYDQINIADCDLKLKYILPDGSEREELLSMDLEPYKTYYSYRLSITSHFTEIDGRIELWLVAIGSNDNIVLKTGTHNITILKKKNHTEDDTKPDEPSTSSKVQVDWNQSDSTAPDYVKNRTHYEETTVVNEPLNITWDGNTEGLVEVAPVEESMYYKVSDYVFTDEQLKLMSEIFTDTDGKYPERNEYASIWDEGVESGLVVPADEVTFCSGIVVARVDGATGVSYGVFHRFPEKGLYFYNNGYEYVASLTTTEPIELTKTVVHKLDKKFLPDDVGGGGIAGKARIYGDRFDKYLYHDEDLTEKMSAVELDALMYSTGVLVYIIGEHSDTLRFPVSYRFNTNIGSRLGLWEDGSVNEYTTKEASSGPM